jgi:hypothetical protein
MMDFVECWDLCWNLLQQRAIDRLAARTETLEERLSVLERYRLGQQAAKTASVEERVSTLERSLDVTHCLLQIFFEQFQARFGEDFLGARLREILSAETKAQAEAQRLVSQVGALLGQKKSAAAIRLYREVVGGTWEQARRAIKGWSSVPQEQKAVQIAEALRLRHVGAKVVLDRAAEVK